MASGTGEILEQQCVALIEATLRTVSGLTVQALDDDELDPEFSALISSYVQDHPEIKETEGTIFFNASCPFVNQLCGGDYTEHQQHLIVEMLYQMARLFSGRTMTAADAIEAFTALTDAMGGLSK